MVRIKNNFKNNIQKEITNSIENIEYLLNTMDKNCNYNKVMTKNILELLKINYLNIKNSLSQRKENELRHD